ncbi:MAG: PAS domain S-box protein [Anaerolineales bacterium]|nr:PAS domain S-box protein [Anaerolineales bacterium]
MSTPLHVLILEDHESDAELMVYELRQAGYEPDWCRVDSERDYLDCLSSALDVILADYTLPQFDAMRALNLLKKRGMEIPFIVVTGTVGEEVVAECMRQGATDYLLKDRLGRLGSAVERALQEKQLNDEKKRAVNALLENEEKYRSLFESSPESITLVGLDGTILDCNEATAVIAGLSRSELIGKSFLNIGTLDEADIPLLVERFTQIVSGKLFEPFQVKAIRRSQEVRWLEIHLALLKRDDEVYAIQVISRDITESKYAEEALRSTNELLQALINAAPLAIDVVDTEGNVKLWSPAAEKLFGWKAEAVIGKPLPSVPEALKSEVSQQIRDELLGTTYYGLETRRVRKDGSLVDVQLWTSPLHDSESEIIGSVGILTDITERKKAEQQIQALNAELLIAYDETLEGWARALDLRDNDTVDHSVRVIDLTMDLARALGIPEPDLIHVRRGALLHDIGKMGIPDAILLKPGPLTEEEWRVMRMHPVFAYDLLSNIPFLRPALEIPYYHHEKWDGSGYPRGLSGEQIPLAARIFSIVDVWDALGSDRPYRARWTRGNILEYVRREAGTRFDPKIVELFLKMV